VFDTRTYEIPDFPDWPGVWGVMMINSHRYDSLKPDCASYFLILVLCLVATGIGVYCALQLEHQGHIISGMNNHVVWGLPHVFAVALIVGASGALNGASLASVFGQSQYQPIAQISVVLAMSLLVGGLLVLHRLSRALRGLSLGDDGTTV